MTGTCPIFGKIECSVNCPQFNTYIGDCNIFAELRRAIREGKIKIPAEAMK